MNLTTKDTTFIKKRTFLFKCKDCGNVTLSRLKYCFSCWDKKNELARFLIIKKAEKKKVL